MNRGKMECSLATNQGVGGSNPSGRANNHAAFSRFHLPEKTSKTLRGHIGHTCTLGMPSPIAHAHGRCARPEGAYGSATEFSAE